MMIKQIFSKIGWSKNKSESSGKSVAVKDFPDTSGEPSTNPAVVPLRSGAMVTKKKDSAEVFNEAVEKLVGKLESINEKSYFTGQAK